MGFSGEHGGSPNGVETTTRFADVSEGSMPETGHEPGGCNGDAPAGPRAKRCGYYRTHLADSAKRIVLQFRLVFNRSNAMCVNLGHAPSGLFL